MTLGWSKSFMHAASLRNSSISLWEKLSTGKERKRRRFKTPRALTPQITPAISLHSTAPAWARGKGPRMSLPFLAV